MDRITFYKRMLDTSPNFPGEDTVEWVLVKICTKGVYKGWIMFPHADGSFVTVGQVDQFSQDMLAAHQKYVDEVPDIQLVSPRGLR